MAVKISEKYLKWYLIKFYKMFVKNGKFKEAFLGHFEETIIRDAENIKKCLWTFWCILFEKISKKFLEKITENFRNSCENFTKFLKTFPEKFVKKIMWTFKKTRNQ